MNNINEIITAFIDGSITKQDAENQISLKLGGTWVLSNIAGEWICTKFKD